jgi:hypothetical protein
LRQYLRVPEDPPESAADRAARLNEGGVVLTWCAGQWAWVWNSTPVTTHHLKGVERQPSGGGALGNEDPLLNLIGEPVDYDAAQTAFEPFAGRPLDADEIAECLAVNFNGVLVRPWPRARLEGNPFNRCSTKRESLLEACARLMAASPMTFTSWDHFIGTVKKTASRITKESTRIVPLDEGAVTGRIVERHEDNLIDRPRRRLTTFECPSVVRALPPGYGRPAPQIREPAVIVAPHRTGCRQWDGCDCPSKAPHRTGCRQMDGCDYPRVEVDSTPSHEASTPGIIPTQPGLVTPTGYRARVQSGWVTRCGTAITFNGRKAVACPTCGLGIPRGADVGLTRVSIDRREPGDPSRVVLGTTLPASPIWTASIDADDEADEENAQPHQGERLQEIYAFTVDPDSEEPAERLRRVLAWTLGPLLAEHRAYEADVMAALDAPRPAVAPRRANRRDRAGLEFQRYVEDEKRTWVDWSFGKDDPADAAPPARVEYRIVDPAARAIHEERHFVTAVRLKQAWGAWHTLADQLKNLQQKQTLQ